MPPRRQRLWYYNAYTGTVDSYDEGTGVPTDVWFRYGDYLTIGFRSRQDAQNSARATHACHRCKSSRHDALGDPCPVCQTPLEGPQQ